jgi:1,4-alpha-glucan branching enzyme
MYTETHPSRRIPGKTHRYSARNMAKPINFYCVAPHARSVALVGDFNSWKPEDHPLSRQPDGSWKITVPLTHGHHRYRFLVDGRPTLDPKATGVTKDEQNERASLLSVS